MRLTMDFVKPQTLLILNLCVCQNVSNKVFLTGLEFQTKIPSVSRVCVQGEQQKNTHTL